MTCSVTHDAPLSFWMLGSFAAGLLFFLAAGPLSESLALRVTSGGLLFAVGAVVVVFFIIAR